MRHGGFRRDRMFNSVNAKDWVWVDSGRKALGLSCRSHAMSSTAGSSPKPDTQVLDLREVAGYHHWWVIFDGPYALLL